MKILFLTDNFPPEYNAPATRTYEHCKEWVSKGADVTVITCFPNFPGGKIYEGYKNKLYAKEVVDGIKVIRVWSFISTNSGLFKRTLDFISYAITSFFAGLYVNTDVIVATSPQFFTAISGYLLSMFKRKKWIMEVRDIWPESISAVNAVNSPRIISFLEKIELHLYKFATKIVVVTDSFKANLTERGVHPDKVCVVKNGVDLSKFVPNNKSEKLKTDLNLNNKIVIGYVGTHGLAHGLPFIVKSIKEAKIQDVDFLFIGDGADKKHVVELSKKLEIQNIKFIDPVHKNEISRYLSIIDIALVPLRKSTTFLSVIPSKIFESAAMLKPILLGVDGESRKIIEGYYAGEYFEPEDTEDFINKLNIIIENNKAELYDIGCKRLATDFDRAKLAYSMLKVIESSVSNAN